MECQVTISTLLPRNIHRLIMPQRRLLRTHPLLRSTPRHKPKPLNRSQIGKRELVADRAALLDASRCHTRSHHGTGGTFLLTVERFVDPSSQSFSTPLCFKIWVSHIFNVSTTNRETNKDVDRKLPDFPRLVNFPDYLSRGQIRTGGDGCGSTAEGKRHCVMCGQLRVCSKSANRMSKPSSMKPDADSTVHIIPRQNKGVCTACDVAVWVMVSQDGLEIKWCKGCKNFRPWAGFGEKGLATKCVRCRHRQREKYASQRRQLNKKEDDDILAAQGLSNLMSSQDS